jgi:glucan-binding YG repeat protein
MNMIRKIKKIIALVLIATSFTTISSIGIFGIDAKAAVNNNTDISLTWQNNNVPLASTSEDTSLETVEEAMLTTKLNSVYSSVSTSNTVSQFEECGSLSYTLDDAAAETIVTTLESYEDTIKTAVTNVGAYGTYYGNDDLTEAASTVSSTLDTLFDLSDDDFITAIQSEAEDITVYKYTVLNGTTTVAQGFAVGGILGLALNPADTYNATEKTATYSSTAFVPSLDLTEGSTYEETIDLSDSDMSIICDGLNINVIDDTNNLLYAINNPVYKLFKSSTSDTLNVIDFSDVTDLEGSTSSIELSSEGITTTVLSISLTTEDSTEKDYEYALPVETYEKTMLDDLIDSYNLSTVGTSIQGMIETGTYTMIPNLTSEIDNLIDESGIEDTVDDITDSLDDLSDALDDFTDSLDDKSDDVDDAWDTVFDRFDNDKGWGTRDGYKYYYDSDGVSLKGVQKIKGKTYYFNRIDGAMETGWQIVDGKKCYFDKEKGYELFIQWVEDNDDRYFVGEDGAVKKMEWVNDAGKNYYLKADGKMTKDWLKIDDYWYFFNPDGSMATSTWKWKDDNWYYLKDNGQSATGWIQLSTKWYYFKDPTGVWQTGWFRADGSWYCTNDDGSMKTGWANSSDGWCYLDEVSGKMKKNEWVTVDDNSYYFNINGIMVTGSRYIDGTKYIFNSDGRLTV